MAKHTQVKIDAKELERAENMWQSFIQISKISTYGVVAILILLWALFIAM
jgi:hypothetical protein